MRDYKLKFKLRRQRLRSKILLRSNRLRLSVFRSNKHIYAQIIDDEAGHTLASCSTLQLKIKNSSTIEAAFEIGKELAKQSLNKEISLIIFDKGRFAYHGRIKSLADGARKQGLIF